MITFLQCQATIDRQEKQVAGQPPSEQGLQYPTSGDVCSNNFVSSESRFLRNPKLHRSSCSPVEPQALLLPWSDLVSQRLATAQCCTKGSLPNLILPADHTNSIAVLREGEERRSTGRISLRHPVNNSLIGNNICPGTCLPDISCCLV